MFKKIQSHSNLLSTPEVFTYRPHRFSWRVIVICLFVAFVTLPTHAALITTLPNLLIAGVRFDVTFHYSVGGLSFNDVWDQDASGTYGKYDVDTVPHAQTCSTAL